VGHNHKINYVFPVEQFKDVRDLVRDFVWYNMENFGELLYPTKSLGIK